VSAEAFWSESSPDGVVVVVRESEPVAIVVPAARARQLAAQLLDAAEAAETHVSRDLHQGLAHRAATLRALRDVLEAGQRLAILYGVERAEARSCSSLDAITDRLNAIARGRTP